MTNDHPLGVNPIGSPECASCIRDLPSLSLCYNKISAAEYSEDTVLVPALVEENLLGIGPAYRRPEPISAVLGAQQRARTCRHSTSNPDNGRTDSTCDEKSDRGKLLK